MAGETDKRADEAMQPLKVGEEAQAFIDTLFQAPVGFALLDRELRYVRINDHLAEINGIAVKDHIGRSVREVLPDLAPKVEPLFLRVLHEGEALLDLDVSGETPAMPGRKRHWLANYYPVRVSTGAVLGVGLVVFEVTERKQLEESLAHRNAELAAREAENSQLVEQLRLAVGELSTPIIEVWDNVLVLPVIGRVDSRRGAQITERLLAEVAARQCRYVIVDITGVGAIDAQTADQFLKLARAVQLLGAECMISGVQAQVAQALVQLGADFGGLKTYRNLKQALEVATARISPSSGASRR